MQPHSNSPVVDAKIDSNSDIALSQLMRFAARPTRAARARGVRAHSTGRAAGGGVAECDARTPRTRGPQETRPRWAVGTHVSALAAAAQPAAGSIETTTRAARCRVPLSSPRFCINISRSSAPRPMVYSSAAHATEAVSERRCTGARGARLELWSLHPRWLRGQLAKRPYDLRHAAASTWLNGGVKPTRVAKWAGHRCGCSWTSIRSASTAGRRSTVTGSRKSCLVGDPSAGLQIATHSVVGVLCQVHRLHRALRQRPVTRGHPQPKIRGRRRQCRCLQPDGQGGCDREGLHPAPVVERDQCMVNQCRDDLGCLASVQQQDDAGLVLSPRRWPARRSVSRLLQSRTRS
jgi:hypothetical protein